MGVHGGVDGVDLFRSGTGGVGSIDIDVDSAGIGIGFGTPGVDLDVMGPDVMDGFRSRSRVMNSFDIIWCG